jgi:hypothetical protein
MAGMVFLTFFVISLLTNILGPIVPDIISSFHVSLTAAGFLALAFFIAYGVMSIPAGFLVERFTEKPVMVVAFLAGTLGSLSFADFPGYLYEPATEFARPGRKPGSPGTGREVQGTRWRHQGLHFGTAEDCGQVLPGRWAIRARIKTPYGQSLWPAFWMLGDDADRARWPGCGEIDIMENIGKEPIMIHGSIHGPGHVGDAVEAHYALPDKKRFADDFLVFAVEWEPQEIRFYVDSDLYATRNLSGIAPRLAVCVRSSVFPAAERGGGRRLAGRSRRVYHVSADHAGGLCAGVPAICRGGQQCL